MQLHKPEQSGIGLRAPHMRELLTSKVSIGFWKLIQKIILVVA